MSRLPLELVLRCNYFIQRTVSKASMPRTRLRPKLDTFNFRLEGDLKRAFLGAAETEDRPAGSILRDFMRTYVAEKEQKPPTSDTVRPTPSIKPERTKGTGTTQRGRRHEQ